MSCYRKVRRPDRQFSSCSLLTIPSSTLQLNRQIECTELFQEIAYRGFLHLMVIALISTS